MNNYLTETGNYKGCKFHNMSFGCTPSAQVGQVVRIKNTLTTHTLDYFTTSKVKLHRFSIFLKSFIAVS